MRIEREYIGRLEAAHRARKRATMLANTLPLKVRQTLAQIPADPKQGALFLRYQADAGRAFYRAVDKFKKHREDLDLPLRTTEAPAGNEAWFEPYKEEMPWSHLQQAAYPSDPVLAQKVSIMKSMEQLMWQMNALDLLEGRPPAIAGGGTGFDRAFEQFAASKKADDEANAAVASGDPEAIARNEANRAEVKSTLDIAYRRWKTWLSDHVDAISISLTGKPPQSAAQPVRSDSGPNLPPKPSV